MNLNIFKRIADLEEKLEWQSTRNERVTSELKAAVSELKTALKEIQSRPRKPSTEKAKAYARAYYLKKKAEREGRKHINFVKVEK